MLEVPTFIDVWVRQLDYSTTTVGRESWNDPANIVEFFMHSEAPGNRWGFSNAEVDAWLDEARATFDFERRKELYSKVEQYRIDHAAPFIVATNGSRFAGLRERIQGWISQRDIRYDFRNVWVSD